MAETSRFWDNIGGVPEYNDAKLSEFYRDIVRDGYVYKTGDEYNITATSPVTMTVNVASGTAFVHGYWHQLDATKNIAITAADGANPRIDRIVLEADIIGSTITVKVIDGTPGAVPVAPTLTQTATKWQLSLGQIYVDTAVVSITSSDITAEKNDDDLCGYSFAPSLATPKTVFDGIIYHLTGADAGTTVNHGAYSTVVSSPTKIYAIGGNTDTNQISIFTPSTTAANGTWASGTDMTTGRYASASCYYHDGTQGRIFVIGGSTGGAAVATNERYNITDNNWSTMASLATARYQCGATELGGYIYCMGGHSSNVMEVYNIAGNSWATKTPLPTIQKAGYTQTCTCVGVGDLVYIAFTDNASVLRFYSYRLATDVYAVLTAPPLDIQSMFAIDGYIYGLTGQTIYRYNITTGLWETLTTTSLLNVGISQYAGIYRNTFYKCYTSTGANGWYTYVRDLSITADKSGVAGFIARNDTKYKLFNTVSLAGGDSIAVKVGQGLKLYINDSAATATATLEILL